MKYNININQKAIVDLGLDLDFVDLAIFDCISAMMQTDLCSKLVMGTDVFFLVKNAVIREQLPLLGISTDKGISKRVDKLIECELIERCPQNQSLRGTYYKMGKNAQVVLFATWNKSSDYNNNYNNYNLDNNKKEDVKDNSFTKKEEDEAFIEEIYAMYPTKCPVRGVSLGKSAKDKDRIKKLLGVYSKDDIRKVVKSEVEEKLGKHMLQNFSTFLNNFPDPNSFFYEAIKKTEDNPYGDNYWQ